ncbi:MAG: universal stress protein [Deltaproteobacteria bacterium]|nr:universal stress protein [Deltaproteobacteria bacterium]
MSRFRKVLVPLDFSACASDVAANAADVAEAFGAQAVLLHVVELPSGVSSSTMIEPKPGEDPVEAGAHMRSGAQERLTRFAPFFEAKGVNVSMHLQSGAIAEAILEGAREVGADLIVMGTHGRQGLSRLMLGSVAEGVMRHATCPVMTVRTLHRAACESANCNWCDSAVTEEARDVEAEQMG